MRKPHAIALTTGSLLAAALAAPAAAQTTPEGGFVALLDKTNNFGDSRKAVVFYDVDDMSTPLFSVFTGEKAPLDSRSLNSLTVDPATGDVYVLAEDRDAAAGTFVPGVPEDGIPDNTEGDYDLLRIDFQSVYNEWATTHNSQYVTFNPGAFGHPSGQNTNEVMFAPAVEKIGEVARVTRNDSPFFDTHLSFVDQDTLLVVDAPQFDEAGENVLADSTIRSLRRVSTEPGQAAWEEGSSVGGFNAGTTESWVSVELGSIGLDGEAGLPSEIDDVAFFRDPVSGVSGLWIGERDNGQNVTTDPSQNQGDQVAFFRIDNFDGTEGNGLAEFAIGQGPDFSNRFVLDDNPTVDPTANNGALDRIFVDPVTGKLVIIESGFFDDPQDEPAVITRDILTIDNGEGRILPGAWGFTQLAVSGADDDDNAVTDGRWTFYDHVNNDVYFFDADNINDGSGSFDADWYRLDLDTGVTELIAFDVDNNGLFGNSDTIEFFFLGGDPLLVGDLNGDGFVGAGDLDILLGVWNQNVGDGVLADLNEDGFIGAGDLDILLGNWNAGIAPTGSAEVVPEPASLALVALGGLAMLRRRR